MSTTSDTEQIDCPACGYRLGDLWEYFVSNDATAEIECEGCGVALNLERNVSVDYVCEVRRGA